MVIAALSDLHGIRSRFEKACRLVNEGIGVEGRVHIASRSLRRIAL
jgi:hypothetical protein